MIYPLLIGTAAGLAGALLFASVASASILSLVLFYLAPLPIMIVGLGWTHIAALVAAAVGSLGLAAVFGTLFSVVFLIGIGLPAWWLAYLTLLARQDGGADGGLEWYPVGRIVLWTTVLGVLAVICVIPSFGADAEAFRAGLRGIFQQLLHPEADATLGLSGESRVLDILVAVTPPSAAAVSLVANLANLWLAARATAISGRLKRPWPDLAAVQLPRIATPALLAAVLAGGFGPDLIGIAGGVLAASLLMAYALVGLGVLHATTRGLNGRSFVLAGIYAAVAVLGWPMLLLSFLGIADIPLGLRRRLTRRVGPRGREP